MDQVIKVLECRDSIIKCLLLSLPASPAASSIRDSGNIGEINYYPHLTQERIVLQKDKMICPQLLKDIIQKSDFPNSVFLSFYISSLSEATSFTNKFFKFSSHFFICPVEP